MKDHTFGPIMILLALSLLHALPAQAAPANITVDVGGTAMIIPPPATMSPVTPEMTKLHALFKTFVPSTNFYLAGFVVTSKLAGLTLDQLPTMERYANLQATQAGLKYTATIAEFAKLKSMLREENTQMVRAFEKEMPKEFQKISEGIKNNLNMDLDLSIGKIIPFSGHEEGDRLFSWSMLATYEVQNGAGDPVKYTVAATNAVVYVKGKVLFLNVYGEQNDLNWTRKAASEWAAAVIAANPSDSATAAQESASPPGFDWGKVPLTAVVGAIVGGLVGLAAVWHRKRNTS